MPDSIVELSFYVALHSLFATDHSATFYIINTSQNRNGASPADAELISVEPKNTKAIPKTKR